MSIINSDLVSLSGKTSIFESVRGGGKRGARKSKRAVEKKASKTRARKSSRKKKRNFCTHY